jgi:hypothetical protein
MRDTLAPGTDVTVTTPGQSVDKAPATVQVFWTMPTR